MKRFIQSILEILRFMGINRIKIRKTTRKDARRETSKIIFEVIKVMIHIATVNA